MLMADMKIGHMDLIGMVPKDSVIKLIMMSYQNLNQEQSPI